MNPERWQQISRIFKSAISLDEAARAAYVKEKCGGDSSLREEVERLIDSHEKAEHENFIGGLALEEAGGLLAETAPEEQKPGLRKGQRLGAYLIMDSLGSGGMGEVYLAQDSRLDRTVALKILAQDVAADKRRMQRFRQEARVASSLNQPNILTIFEFGEVEAMTFLATEFVDGETLRDYMRGKRLKLTEILDIGLHILAALDAAHEASIVHRDIKPENVMIRRRDHLVKVLDFGLAKVTERKTATAADAASDEEAVTAFKTAPGLVMGTVNYMSPEQAQGRSVDARSDIWSTGVVIYELVAGTKPFGGATTSHTIVQILETEPAALTELQHVKVPDELQRIVSKAIAKDPEDRYQTARDMMIDLRNLKRRLENVPSVAPALPEKIRPQMKSIVVVAVVAVAVALAGVLGVNAWLNSRQQADAPVAAPEAARPPERTLAYWITVQKFKDEKPYEDPFELAGEINFEADYQIKLNVRSPQAGYLYVLNEGPRKATEPPEFVALFPSATSNRGSGFLAEDQNVQIPDRSWIQFDKQRGVEKLWLVFSGAAIPELEAVKPFASARTSGLITDPSLNAAVHNFLNSYLGQKPEYEKTDTRTTLKTAQPILVYPIRLEHH